MVVGVTNRGGTYGLRTLKLSKHGVKFPSHFDFLTKPILILGFRLGCDFV